MTALPSVELRFSSVPAHVRTARLVAVAMARRAGVDEGLLDEVRLAVGEACSRAVELHRVSCPDEMVSVQLGDGEGRFVVRVLDRAGTQPEEPAVLDDLDAGIGAGGTGGMDTGDLGARALPAGIGLAVIAGLVDDSEVQSGPHGCIVRMSWPCRGGLATVTGAP